ncbi:breast cancer type 2 susceptibility protein isoform X2 [Engystomops pustulosus]|uniref:breast cancer type 2 susceptibility protein isoform X2 n=1 Tax=Engystomops pustulosus TaxID=76066 RepID=UPI003AFA1644
MPREVEAVQCLWSLCLGAGHGIDGAARTDVNVTIMASVFLRLFQEHCSHSDLGQININWFEDLTREAVRLQPRIHEDEDNRGVRQGDNLLKTPQQRRSHYSQLESTPTIFREQSLCSPLFLSPTKDHDKSQYTGGNFSNVTKTEQTPDNTVPAHQAFGTSNRYLTESPVVLKQLFKTPFRDGKYQHRTPQQNRKFDFSDSLLCTPQLMRNQSSRCISESLGVEADSEMSWSSSMATPLSPTVIIAQDKEEAPKPREYNIEDVVIVRSLFSKMNGVTDTISSSPPPANNNSDGTNIKATTSENTEKSSGYMKAQQKKTVLNTVGDEEARQVVENAIEGMEDVLSIFFTNEKPPELRKVKVDRRIKRKNKPFSAVPEICDSPIENTKEQGMLYDVKNHNINSNVIQQKTCSREISLSYEWTPLNLPDTTQEEKLAIENGGRGDCNVMENCSYKDSHLHTDKIHICNTNLDGPSSSSQYEEKPKEGADVAEDDNKNLLGLALGHRSSSFATEYNNTWKNNNIADQAPKPMLSMLKRPTKFTYCLKGDCQETKNEQKDDMALASGPSNLMETLGAKSSRPSDLTYAEVSNNLPEVKLGVKEGDGEMKESSMDIQEIEETFMNIIQNGPTDTAAISEVKSNFDGDPLPSTSQECTIVETNLPQRCAKDDVLKSVIDREHNSKVNNWDSASSISHLKKAEYNSANEKCGDLLIVTNMQSFGGFKTASNKNIHISEESLRKGERLLKEVEVLPTSGPAKAENGDEEPLSVMTETGDAMGFQTASRKKIIVTETGLAKGIRLFQDIKQEIHQTPKKRRRTDAIDWTASNVENVQVGMTINIKPTASGDMDEVAHDVKGENKMPTISPTPDSKSKGDVKSLKENSAALLNTSPTKINRKTFHSLSSGTQSTLHDIFTESQKAEINELSSILENAGSQFDFTQVKKLNVLRSDSENVQNAGSITDSEKLNTSDVWKDVDFNDSFATGEEKVESNVVSVASESTSDSDVTADKKALLDSCYKLGNGAVAGFTMASGKSVGITDEDLIKAMEMFGDLEENGKEKCTKTIKDLKCLANAQSFDVLHVAVEGKTSTLPVQETTSISPLEQTKKKYLSKQEHKRNSNEMGVAVLTTNKTENGDASSSFLSKVQVGFATGKGKLINVNKAALDKARTMFSDILDSSDPCKDHCTLEEPSKVFDETNADQAPTTFVGKDGTMPRPMGPLALSKVSKVFSDGHLEKPKQELCMLQKEGTKESSLPQKNNLLSSISLFSTASGKPVQLSEEGVKRAHKIFSEVDDGGLEDHESSSIYLTNSTDNIGSFHDLKNETVQVKEATSNFHHPGFSTANGKVIGVSQKFLQKAQEIFADIAELNDLDVGQRNPNHHSKTEAGDQEKNQACDVLESADQGRSSNISQDRKMKPLVNQVVDRFSRKEISTKTYSCEDKITNLSRTSFSTAGGKSIQLSEDSLKKAQGLFADLDDNLLLDPGRVCTSVNQNARQYPNPKLPPLGFSTASGKTVAVSPSSLLKAKKMFADADDASEVVCKFESKIPSKSLDTFKPNQKTTEVISKKSLCTNPKVVDTGIFQKEASNQKNAYFSTASGNPVHFSSKALQKAREMFADLNDDQIKDQSLQESVQTGSKIKENNLSSVKGKNLENIHRPTVQFKSPVVALPPIAFNTASGKAVTVSHDSLQKAKLLFVDADNLVDPADSSKLNTAVRTNQTQEKEGSFVVETCQTSKRRSSVDSSLRNDPGEPMVEDCSVPKMSCFSTAGGKSVTVSKESLKRARQIFSEVDNGCSSHCDASVDIPPNSKPTPVAKVSLRESEIKHSSKASFGFSTASGKQVHVSEGALQKVKGIFEELDNNENSRDNLAVNQASSRMKPFVNTNQECPEKNTVGSGGAQNTSTRPSDVPSRNAPPSQFVKPSTPFYGPGRTNLYFTSSHTPENDFELEAAESAKAFMDDEDLTDGLPPSTDKLPSVRFGKRLRSDDGIPRGEPPIKRQLLPEFDRSLENKSKAALNPLTSNPHESLKDRRKYLYKVSLKPLSSDPASFLHGTKATLETSHTDQNHRYSQFNVSDSSSQTTSTRAGADCGNDLKNASRCVKGSSLIPFKNKLHIHSAGQTLNSPRRDQGGTEDVCRSRIEVEDESGMDFSDLIPNISCARDMQEMRIRKKQKQRIRPQPGSLYQQKSSSADRINLVTAVEGRTPTVYPQAELYRCGVLKNHIGINSEKAGSFQFYCLDFFTREPFLSNGGVQIADGGWLVPSEDLTAGREEFYRALCDTPGVDPKLISPEWVYNHYRWIVWKLAAMEVMFPMIFASRCLTPSRVLLQLKYRYDVEVDKCRRSAVRKIMERDDTAAKTLVLCISKVLTLGHSENSDTKQTSAMIEVTDGWYGIKALLDPALSSLLRKGRLFPGQKIMVHGAELVGSDDACTPLEAPESLMLKIAGNSTRPARWFVKLGYFPDPRPFCLRLSSLLADGGIAGCVDVLIQRIYPMQWMEKMGNGTYMFRNERAEEKEAERHAARQQRSLEALFAKIQDDYEKQQVAVKRRPRRQSLSEQQILALQDGAELYDALQNEPDPSYLESCLSSDQLRALNHHRQLLNDKRQAQIQADFRKAIESSEQETGSSTRREVTPVWKIRITDYKDPDSTSAYMLSIWRPLPDVVSLLKEGGRFRMYQLAASQSRGKSDTAAVQLTATKKTQFQQLQPLQDILEQIYTERQVTEFSQFQEPHFTAVYGEVDVVGLVISTQQKPGAAPLVYLSDESCNVVALKFCTDLGQLALEEITRPGTFIAATNLRWRSEHMSGVPVVFAGDLSFIAANPKEQHVLKAIQKLSQSIQSVSEFCKEMENKLMEILQTQNPKERALLSRCSLDPRSLVAAEGRCSTPLPKISHPQMSIPNGNINTDPKTCKKMKGLDYLSRIPPPAPLTPMRTLLSPSLQRAFRPPRSLQKEDRPCEKACASMDCSTPSKLEGGFVADEELAMINTQALVSGLDGGKLSSEQERAGSDIQKTPPIVVSPASEEAPKTEDVTPAPYKRRLCRRRKQKP